MCENSKSPLFRGSFCKFKGVPQISPEKYPEIRDQRPKKPIIDQSLFRPVTKHQPSAI